MQPLVTFAILPQDACLEQALSKKVTPEMRSQVFAEIAAEQALKMTKEARVERARHAAKGRWAKERAKKKKPKP